MNEDKIFAYLVSTLIMIFFYAALWTCSLDLSLKLLFNGFLILGHLRLLIDISDIDI